MPQRTLKVSTSPFISISLCPTSRATIPVMQTRIQRGSTLVRYAVLLATLVVVLLASFPPAVHTRFLGGPYIASSLKRTLPNLNNGRSLSNAERLARGLPLKKPQLPRSGERPRRFVQFRSLSDQSWIGGRLRARQSATPTSGTSTSTTSSSSSSSATPSTPAVLVGTIQVYSTPPQIVGWVGLWRDAVYGVVSNGTSDPAVVVSISTDPSITYHELAIQVCIWGCLVLFCLRCNIFTLFYGANILCDQRIRKILQSPSWEASTPSHLQLC